MTGQSLIECSDTDLLFHFDMEEHSLPLQEFITSARAAEAIIGDFNKEFFEGKLKFQLEVFPPLNGSFIEILGLVLLGGGGVVWTFAESSIGSSFIEGITNHPPSYWAKIAGQKLKNKSKEGSTLKADKKSVAIEDIAAVIIINQITVGFILKEPEKLKKIGLFKKNFLQAYKAKNNFFNACYHNPRIRGVGFSKEHIFPIKRSDFAKHIVDIPAEAMIENEPINWVVGIDDVMVNSPNWDKSGRVWQAHYKIDKEVTFSVEDENFWHHVKEKDIQPDINDYMQVQWAYDPGSKRSRKVLKVLMYNGQKLAEPLGDEQIKKWLENYTHVDEAQIDLFVPKQTK